MSDGPLAPSELARRADVSLAESLREEARHSAGATVHEEDGLVVCQGTETLPLAPNAVMRAGDRDGAGDAERDLARAEAAFAPRRQGYRFQVRLGAGDAELEAVLAAADPLLVVDSAAMVLDRPLDPPDPGLDLRPVVDAAGAADYAAVVDEAYQSLGWPAGGPAALFASPGQVLHPAKAAFAAYVGDRPAAVAYIHVVAGVGLVSWVGTTADARRRGLGEAVTRAAVNAGFARGAAVAWLTASQMGEPLYRRLGFSEFARSRSYVFWPGVHPAPPG